MIWSRSRFACFTPLLATLLCTLQLPAQEARWLELNSRATELYRQGKYAECVPVVTEALKTADQTRENAPVHILQGFTGCGKTHVLYQGTTLVVPQTIENTSAFRP